MLCVVYTYQVLLQSSAHWIDKCFLVKTRNVENTKRKVARIKIIWNVLQRTGPTSLCVQIHNDTNTNTQIHKYINARKCNSMCLQLQTLRMWDFVATCVSNGSLQCNPISLSFAVSFNVATLEIFTKPGHNRGNQRVPKEIKTERPSQSFLLAKQRSGSIVGGARTNNVQIYYFTAVEGT